MKKITKRFSLIIRCIVLLGCTKQAIGLSENLHNYLVDFDKSMGKDDPYMDKHYKILLEEIQKETNCFKCLSPYTGQDLLNFTKTVYEEKKMLIFSPPKTQKIPRIFHQIWIGKNPFPQKYKSWQQAWQKVPGWIYKLWTDEDIESLNLHNKDLYYREKNLGARADMLRMEILYQFGGVYIDTDYELLQPELFTILNSAYDFYCGMAPVDSLKWGYFYLNNAIIGSVPGHPILNAYIKNLRYVDASAEIVSKGPGLFTRMILEHANKTHCDMLFPPTFFYPVGNVQMQDDYYMQIADPWQKMKALKRNCCKPETLAIHWWDGSWTLPQSWVRD